MTSAPRPLVERAQRRGPVAAREHRLVGAGTARDLGLLGAARDRDHARSEPARNLHDAPSPGHPRRRARQCAHRSARVRGAPRRNARCGGSSGNRPPLPHPIPLGSATVRRGSASASSANPPSMVNAITICPLRSPLCSGRAAHPARHLDAGHERKRRFHLVQAAREQQVGKAHARSGDLDEHTAVVVHIVELHLLQRRRAVEGRQLQRAHVVSL